MRETEWIRIFAGNLSEIIEESGYSQKEVADMTGIMQSTISKYINGRLMPSLKNVVNLAYALNCDVRELCDFGDYIDQIVGGESDENTFSYSYTFDNIIRNQNHYY